VWTTLASGITLVYFPRNPSLKRNEPLLPDPPVECVDGVLPEQHRGKVHDETIPNIMELDGGRKVGLVEISCPGALVNVHGDEYVFRVINRARNFGLIVT